MAFAQVAPFCVMAGLDPAIHVLARGEISVDDRDKPGHDDEAETRQIFKCDFPGSRGDAEKIYRHHGAGGEKVARWIA
jgi:hypothetical protein